MAAGLASLVLIPVVGAPTTTADATAGSGFEVVVRGGLNGTATATWTQPSDPGTGVTAYSVTSDSGTAPGDLPPDARSATVTGMDSRYTRAVDVGWRDDDWHGGSEARYIMPSLTQLRISNTKPARGTAVTFIGEVRGQIEGMPVALQRRYPGSSIWSTALGGVTGSAGTVTWRFHVYRAAYYRAVSKGCPNNFGSVSFTRGVVVR